MRLPTEQHELTVGHPAAVYFDIELKIKEMSEILILNYLFLSGLQKRSLRVLAVSCRANLLII